MTIALYQHVPRAITLGLRLREVDVITAYEVGASRMDDPDLLDRANELRRVLFTRDDDLLVEATKRQREGNPFGGIIYAHQMRVSIGACIHDLEIIAKASEPQDMQNQVLFLPL